MSSIDTSIVALDGARPDSMAGPWIVLLNK